MGAESNMGGASTPQTTPTAGTGMQPGGMNLSQLFMNNAPTNQAGGGMQLPQIMAPARQPMPTMPVRTPMPQMQAPAPLTGPLVMREAMMQRLQKDGAPSAMDRWWMRHQTNNR